MKSRFIPFMIGFLLLGCAPVSAPTATLPHLSPTSTPLSISPATATVIPSPTDLPLPSNSETASDDYCKPPYAVLPVGDDNDISEDEIVYELMNVWLRRYSDPNAPLFCRIDAFTIDEVYYDMDILSQPLEPRGDFMRVVVFAVKLIQAANAWMGFSGELDPENWLHVRHAVAVFGTPEGYTMQFAYP